MARHWRPHAVDATRSLALRLLGGVEKVDEASAYVYPQHLGDRRDGLLRRVVQVVGREDV